MTQTTASTTKTAPKTAPESAPEAAAPGLSLSAGTAVPVTPVAYSLGGLPVMLRWISSPMQAAIDVQVPEVTGPNEHEANRHGGVLAGSKKGYLQRKARNFDRRLALRLLAAGSVEGGIDIDGERWDTTRDAAWCEAAADRLLDGIPLVALNEAMAFVGGLSPFSAPLADRIGTGTTPGK